jgi:hypothetical protein
MTQTATMTPNPQCMEALERANNVRHARAELKRRIAAGEITAADVLLDCPVEAATWRVGDLLRTQRSWGKTRARKFLDQSAITISELKRVGELTDRQRRILAGELLSAPVARPLIAH